MRLIQKLFLMASVCVAGHTQGALLSFDLMDHPDGNQNPPPYGLRFDGIFAAMGGAVGGVTSFSFDAAIADLTQTNMALVVDTGANTITISGSVFGGEDAGSIYGFGAGWYDIDFTYRINVQQLANGWNIDAFNSQNFGTITSQGNADVAAGWSHTFYDQAVPSFEFLQDDHRLAGTGLEGLGLYVGRGWVTSNSDGTNTTGTQDWLFVTVPAPGAASVLGIAGLCAIRRRRS